MPADIPTRNKPPGQKRQAAADIIAPTICRVKATCRQLADAEDERRPFDGDEAMKLERAYRAPGAGRWPRHHRFRQRVTTGTQYDVLAPASRRDYRRVSAGVMKEGSVEWAAMPTHRQASSRNTSLRATISFTGATRSTRRLRRLA